MLPDLWTYSTTGRYKQWGSANSSSPGGLACPPVKTCPRTTNGCHETEAAVCAGPGLPDGVWQVLTLWLPSLLHMGEAWYGVRPDTWGRDNSALEVQRSNTMDTKEFSKVPGSGSGNTPIIANRCDEFRSWLRGHLCEAGRYTVVTQSDIQKEKNPCFSYLLREAGSSRLFRVTKWRAFKNCCGQFENFL